MIAAAAVGASNVVVVVISENRVSSMWAVVIGEGGCCALDVRYKNEWKKLFSGLFQGM